MFFFLGNLKVIASHLEKAWRILLIHISFFSIFKALSNKSNLYFACSSPLRDTAGGHIHLSLSKNSVHLNSLFVNIFSTIKARDTIQTVLESA